MTAAADKRMTSEGQHAPVGGLLHVIKISDPVFKHVAGLGHAGADCITGTHVFEMRRVISRPTDRQLDQRSRRPELRRLVQIKHIAPARVIHAVVVTHHAGVVGETMLDKEIH